MDPNMSMEEQKHQQLAAFLSVLAQQTPLNPSTKQSSSAGPSKQNICVVLFTYVALLIKCLSLLLPTGPALRSRLVWDPAHIVYLESWYGRETRYPNLAQCQAYANQLSQVPQTGKLSSSY